MHRFVKVQMPFEFILCGHFLLNTKTPKMPTFRYGQVQPKGIPDHSVIEHPRGKGEGQTQARKTHPPKAKNPAT